MATPSELQFFPTGLQISRGTSSGILTGPLRGIGALHFMGSCSSAQYQLIAGTRDEVAEGVIGGSPSDHHSQIGAIHTSEHQLEPGHPLSPIPRGLENSGAQGIQHQLTGTHGH